MARVTNRNERYGKGGAKLDSQVDRFEPKRIDQHPRSPMEERSEPENAMATDVCDSGSSSGPIFRIKRNSASASEDRPIGMDDPKSSQILLGKALDESKTDSPDLLAHNRILARLNEVTQTLVATNVFANARSTEWKKMTALQNLQPKEVLKYFQNSLKKLEVRINTELPYDLCSQKDANQSKNRRSNVVSSKGAEAFTEENVCPPLELTQEDFDLMGKCLKTIAQSIETIKLPPDCGVKAVQVSSALEKFQDIQGAIHRSISKSSIEPSLSCIQRLMTSLGKQTENENSGASTRTLTADLTDTEILEGLRNYLDLTRWRRDDARDESASASGQSDRLVGFDPQVASSSCEELEARLIVEENTLATLAREVFVRSEEVYEQNLKINHQSLEMYYLFLEAVRENEVENRKLAIRERRLLNHLEEIEKYLISLEKFNDYQERQMNWHTTVCAEYFLSLTELQDRFSFRIEGYSKDLKTIVNSWSLLDRAKQDLASREKAASKMKQDYYTKTEQLEKRNREAVARDKLAKSQIARVAQREQSLVSQTKSAKEKEKDAADREAEAISKLAELEMKIDIATKKAAQTDFVRGQLEADQGNLAVQASKLTSLEDDLKARREQLRGETERLEEREARLKDRDAQGLKEIEQRMIKVQDAEAQLKRDLDKFEKRQKDFETKQRKSQRQRQAVPITAQVDPAKNADDIAESEAHNSILKCAKCDTLLNLLDVLQEKDRNRRDQDFAVQQALEAIRLRENSMQELAESLRAKDRDLIKWQGNLDLHEKLITSDLAKCEAADAVKIASLLREGIMNIAKKIGSHALISALGPSLYDQLSKASK